MSREYDPLLHLLRERYGDRWAIRRTAHLWIANPRNYSAEHAPTLVEPDVDEFVRQLEHPPPAAGRSILSRPWFRDQVKCIGEDGAVRLDGRP